MVNSGVYNTAIYLFGQTKIKKNNCNEDVDLGYNLFIIPRTCSRIQICFGQYFTVQSGA